MALTTVILAAGQGKRMNSALPKVLQPLAGRPMLSHLLETANALAPQAINVVYGHGGEIVPEAFSGSAVDWTLQAEQRGTGHALNQALPGIPDDHQILVLFGDVPLVTTASLKALLEHALPDGVALLTAIVEKPKGYGRVLRDDSGAVTAIVEDKDATPAQRAIKEINTGLMVLPGGAIRRWVEAVRDDNAQGEFYLTDVISVAVGEGVPVVGVSVAESNEVLGINDRAQLAAAERVLQRRYALEVMAQGATLADPGRFDLRGKLTVGRDVFIDVGAVFTGDVVLGDRVRIGSNSAVSDSSLGEDCLVHEHCVIDGVVAGASCEIGPFARLRPGTEFQERVKVGNFVEVKASNVAPGSKINHLSYVGDTSVGRDVNVGAGTITCNYDGVAKYRTQIGDEVFVGSGVMLVAPLEVGAGATIAAGSTITKNVPGEALAVGRNRQSTVKGWKRPAKPSK